MFGMNVPLVRFLFGVVILLISTQLFVKLSVRLSHILRVSPLIIGMIVLSFGTTLPELSVSIMSHVSDSDGVGLASGTIVGSTIVNFLLIFPAAILMGEDIRVGTTKTQRNSLILIAAVIFFLLMQKLNIPAVISGILLILSLFATNFLELKWGIAGRIHEDKTVMDLFKKEKITADLIIGLIFSVICVTLGGLIVVVSMEELASMWGYSTTVLGLTLSGVVTSLPDLFTAVSSQRKDEDKLTIGHIVGGSLYNLLFIGGIINIIGGKMNLGLIESGFLFITAFLFFLILHFYKGKNIPKWVGMVFLLMFFIYIYVVSFYGKSI